MVLPPPLVAKFADETDVFGLHLFNTHRSRFEVVFWCLFVAGFGCYTVTTLVSITQKFVGEETVSYVNETKEANFTFPFAEICFLGTPVANSAMPVGVALQLVAEKFNNPSDTVWEAGAFIAVAKFLTDLQQAEKTLSLLDQPSKPEAIPLFDVNTLEGLRIFRKYFPKKTIPDLSDFLILELCRTLNLRASFVEASSNISGSLTEIADAYAANAPGLCEIGDPAATLAFAFPNAFCVDTQRIGLTFKAGVTKLMVTFDTAKATEKFGVSTLAVEFFTKNVLSEALEQLMDSMAVLTTGRLVLHQIRVSSAHKLLDLRRRPCSDERTETTWCKSICKARSFYSSFGCWPLLYRSQLSPLRQNVSNVRPCEAEDYLNFTRLSLKAVPQNGRDCLGACKEKCTQRTYSVTSTNTSPAKSPTSAVSTIMVQSTVYNVFEERLANDFESFLSDFGGALGLFLGASFASVVHIPMFLLQAVVARWCRKPESKSTKEVVKMEMPTVGSGAKEAIVSEVLQVMRLELVRIERDLVARLDSSNMATLEHPV